VRDDGDDEENDEAKNQILRHPRRLSQRPLRQNVNCANSEAKSTSRAGPVCWQGWAPLTFSMRYGASDRVGAANDLSADGTKRAAQLVTTTGPTRSPIRRASTPSS
jgi:hypothetical protein